MRVSTLPARPHRARLAILVAATLCALALAGCGSNPKPTAVTIVPNPGVPPPPTLTLFGDPRLHVNIQGSVRRSAAEDTLSGYFYVVLTDSLSRYQFISGVTLNGVPMRAEADGFGAPYRYSLLPTDLGASYDAGDSLQLAFADTSGKTGPFAITVRPSTFSLPPDGTVVSQAKDLLLTWSGSAGRLQIKLSDHNGDQISANMQFANETGVSELLIRSQDLKQLEPGVLIVGSDIVSSAFQTTARPRFVQATMDVSESRKWQLAP